MDWKLDELEEKLEEEKETQEEFIERAVTAIRSRISNLSDQGPLSSLVVMPGDTKIHLSVESRGDEIRIASFDLIEIVRMFSEKTPMELNKEKTDKFLKNWKKKKEEKGC